MVVVLLGLLAPTSFAQFSFDKSRLLTLFTYTIFLYQVVSVCLTGRGKEAKITVSLQAQGKKKISRGPFALCDCLVLVFLLSKVLAPRLFVCCVLMPCHEFFCHLLISCPKKWITVLNFRHCCCVIVVVGIVMFVDYYIYLLIK